eukprot:1813127-Pyramimonas_sp.AAC.1
MQRDLRRLDDLEKRMKAAEARLNEIENPPEAKARCMSKRKVKAKANKPKAKAKAKAKARAQR